MPARRIICIDTETTGLDQARNKIWEIGMAELVSSDLGKWRVKNTTSWQVRLTEAQIAAADPEALKINKFEDRYLKVEPLAVDISAKLLYEITEYQTVACNIPTFDIPFLGAHLKESGYTPAWHHRVIDIRSVVLGAIPVLEPDYYQASLADLAQRIGYRQDESTLHTAAGDAGWAAKVLAGVLSTVASSTVGLGGTDPD